MATGTSTRALRWEEGRRVRAWELAQQGWRQADIVRALGVSKGAVSQWLKRAREGGGPQALRHRPPPGRQPRLTAAQKARIPELLARGPEASGFAGDVWTASRVAGVIWREYGVRYHRDHVGKLLRACGWSPQKPITRASQRDERAIET